MALESFLKAYEARTPKSRALYEEARGLLPGGVAGSAAYLAPYPLYAERAEGGRLVDIDGNEYIDLLLGGFPNILGHRAPAVVEAVKGQLDLAIAPILFNRNGVELARKIMQHVPYLERLRFCNSGSEATQCALRVARAWTGKSKVAKIEGGFNGGHDYALVSGASGRVDGPPERPQPIADSAGIPRFVIENTVVLPFNDVAGSVALIEQHAADLAAVIVEPMPAFGMGNVPADPEYLFALREVTTRCEVVLVYDEIVTGFRLGGMGGAAAFYGVAPDLGCFGKPIGGGFPIGAFGGRADMMEKTCNPAADAAFKIFQSGTFTGNPVAMTAGLACLTELERRDYAQIDGLGARLRAELTRLGERHGFPVQVTGLGSIFMPHFNAGPIRNNRDKLKGDVARQRAFCMGMIANGVYLPPMHAGAVCFAHDEADVTQILAVADRVLGQMAA